MGLDFQYAGYENLFKKALREGINIFCGAGFSVEATDRTGSKLPTGEQLLEELKNRFPSIDAYKNLPRACTKLEQTTKKEFYDFLEERFKVESYDKKYDNILLANVKKVYTTNIDDLFLQIYRNKPGDKYLNDKSSNGATYDDDQYALNYFPLHGSITNPGEYVFGVNEIACAFQKKDLQKSWKSLADDSANQPILFWGWNFEDTGPIEAMYGNQSRIDENITKWVLLYKYNEEMVDFLQALNFNIIIGDTIDMLDYIGCECERKEKSEQEISDTEVGSYVKKFEFPKNNTDLPVYPLNTFFLDYVPRWSHIYSGEIPRLSYYSLISDSLAAGRNIVVIGMRGSGKTTLLMQLLVNYRDVRMKHWMVAPNEEQVLLYLKELRGQKSLVFVDDCFRDTFAVIQLLKATNVQVVLFDRDFNFERQYHRIREYDFEKIDITEITEIDAQKIINVIPEEIKKPNFRISKFKKDPTLLNLMASCMKTRQFNFIREFVSKDYDAARVFLMICYVHACGVPCSFDMIYSFLGDENYAWKEMYEIIQRAGGLIRELDNQLESYNLVDTIQSYYQCRSRFFAEKIISSVPNGNETFARVLQDFAENVPTYKICQYDKFKRSGYDADFSSRAFMNEQDGEEYYKACALQDESEYVYQQAAIFFSRKNNYKKAFQWIDKARNMAHYNRFSVDSTYAQLYFDVNIKTDKTQAKNALDILENCCRNDRRKIIHFSAYAKRVLEFCDTYEDEEALAYVSRALEIIEEGMQDTNLGLSKKNRWELKDYRDKMMLYKNRRI